MFLYLVELLVLARAPSPEPAASCAWRERLFDGGRERLHEVRVLRHEAHFDAALLQGRRDDGTDRRDFGAFECRLHQFERGDRSEEHTSELQSREKLVCRLLLEKK